MQTPIKENFAAPDFSGAAWSSVAVRLAAARPDQRVAFAVFVVEEIGVDRRREARIVELDRKIVAAFGGSGR